MDANNKDYIGDGVYVEFDGFGIKVMANSPDNPTDTIYFEPDVSSKFIDFIKRVYHD